jgi:hypothetical protein
MCNIWNDAEMRRKTQIWILESSIYSNKENINTFHFKLEKIVLIFIFHRICTSESASISTCKEWIYIKIQREKHLKYIWISIYSNSRCKSTFIFEKSIWCIGLSSLIESAVQKIHQFKVEVYETTLKFNEELEKNYCRSPSNRINDILTHFSM